MTQRLGLTSWISTLLTLHACTAGGTVTIDAGNADTESEQRGHMQTEAKAGRDAPPSSGASVRRGDATTMDAGSSHMAADAATIDTRSPRMAADASIVEAARSAPDDEDAAAPATDAAEPDGLRVETELKWVLDTIAQGVPGTVELAAHFAPDFLAEVPAEALIQVFTQLQSLNPIQVVRHVTSAPFATLVELSTAAGSRLLSLQIEPTAPYRITGLRFTPIPTSYDEAETLLQALASDIQLHIAELSDASCRTVQARGVAKPLAIGSAFKLWVLHALDRRLASDPELDWSSPLSIQDELKSLPFGRLQDEPAGATLSLREFARAMISISDNTATDHLIEFLGRTTVEREQTETRHSAPHLNTPWLYTRELFALKLWATGEQVQAIRDAELEQKRELLDQLRSQPLDPSNAASWSSPRQLDFEWFANGEDLCNVYSSLAQRGQFEPQSEVLQTLSLNPGIPFDPEVWTYIGYKGGSEPGVLNLSWLLRRADGRWFTLVITLNDSTRVLDTSIEVGIAYGVAQVLGAAE